jgi:hypothetical protein
MISNGSKIRLNVAGAKTETVMDITENMVKTFEGGYYHISKIALAK